MVSDIAKEIGVDASELLQVEVDALGKRLENVRDAISVLADIADAQIANEEECNKNIDDIKSNLKEIQTVLNKRFSLFIKHGKRFSIFLSFPIRQ